MDGKHANKNEVVACRAALEQRMANNRFTKLGLCRVCEQPLPHDDEQSERCTFIMEHDVPPEEFATYNIEDCPRCGMPCDPELDEKGCRCKAPVTVAVATSTLTDIRDWNEPRSGVSGERLRNCIIYALDHTKNDYYRKNPTAVRL